MSVKDDVQRHLDAAHAMQTGVKYQMMKDGDSIAGTTPKSLRVGINSAMADQAGLAKLLIAKGIFTEEEYIHAVADSMEEERDRYQALMPENVTLA
jgi:hypothetical protein